MNSQSPTRADVIQDGVVARIENKTARVAVIGAGHVGLPLVVEIARSGFRTVALDVDRGRVDAINAGRSYIGDVTTSALADVVASGHLSASVDPDVLHQSDVMIVCVPTPLNKSRHPDTSFIVQAASTIVPRMRSQQLIVLESTTFPGFTREILLEQLQTSGLVLDRDFFLAFSPERVDPGNQIYFTRNTPKVVGGASPASLGVALSLYRSFVETLVPVSSTDAAEMVKLLENTFRAVNIALANEFSIMCRRLQLETKEIIDAASSKPFGYMPFHPGPGLGGHCIPVDPLFLSWKLKTLKYNARFVQLADEINSEMPSFVVDVIGQALNQKGIEIAHSKLLIVGITYKRDVADIRESPAVDVFKILMDRGATVSYHDPIFQSLEIGGQRFESANLESIANYDGVVIATDHSSLNYGDLVDRARLVVDCRNATRNLPETLKRKVTVL
jgi:UDP-N-acetyl-D-glucosamine dehydrogenase